MKKLFTFLTRNPYGAFLFSFIGLVVGYWVFVKYLGQENPAALIGFAAAIVIILVVNMKYKWE